MMGREKLIKKKCGVCIYLQQVGLGKLVILDNDQQTQQIAVCRNGWHQTDRTALGDSGCDGHIEIVVAHVPAQLRSNKHLLLSQGHHHGGNIGVENELWHDGLWCSGLENSLQHSCQRDKVENIGVGLWGDGWSRWVWCVGGATHNNTKHTLAYIFSAWVLDCRLIDRSHPHPLACSEVCLWGEFSLSKTVFVFFLGLLNQQGVGLFLESTTRPCPIGRAL